MSKRELNTDSGKNLSLQTTWGIEKGPDHSIFRKKLPGQEIFLLGTVFTGHVPRVCVRHAGLKYGNNSLSLWKDYKKFLFFLL